MKLRVQELIWQSGNQLFQVQRYDKDNDFWYATEDGPHNTLEAAIAAAKLMLNPPPRAPIQERIHELQ